jgi:hypothetical protein
MKAAAQNVVPVSVMAAESVQRLRQMQGSARTPYILKNVGRV